MPELGRVTLGTVEKLLERESVCLLFRAGTDIDGGWFKMALEPGVRSGK